jgi:hypothetical protein
MGEHKVERLRERLLTRGEVGLAAWHRAWRRIMFGTALGLMSASLFAITWALALVGIPRWLALPVAVVMEVGMAGVASTATTIRKPRSAKRDGTPRPDGYYLSLWVIFSFMMLLAQAANVGHAVVKVSDQIGTLPAWLPHAAVYGFAAAFAALFPLGGTLFIHVSGFLRAHGVGADWIDADAESVRVRDETARVPRTRGNRVPAKTSHGDGDAPQDETRDEPVPVPHAETAPERALEYPRDPARQALLETLVERLRAQPDAAAKDLLTTDEVKAATGITDNGNARTFRGKLYGQAQTRLTAEAEQGLTDAWVETVLTEPEPGLSDAWVETGEREPESVAS